MYRTPIVFILGATGTGKSKLAIHIAKMFNGEIISADSMQVYEGLDIMSNKVTPLEQAEVRHHLLDICQPMDQFTVLDFKNRALPIIKDLVKQSKLPIIAGGTNYYIESIIWNNLLSDYFGDENIYEGLRFNRVRVMKDPDAIDKWKTFHQEKKTDAEKEQTNCFSNDFKRFIDDLERKVLYFDESLRELIQDMKLTVSLYKRTFYKLENFINQDKNEILERSTYFSFQDCEDLPMDFRELEQNLSDASVIHIEQYLMNRFLSACLDRVILYLKNVYDNCDVQHSHPSAAFYDMDHPICLWNSKSVDLLLKSSFVPNNLQAQIQTLRHICYSLQIPENNMKSTTVCNMLQKLQNIVNDAVNMRLARLKLIRVVDDANMVDFSNEYLYSQLQLIDKQRADSIHPNTRRRIMSALSIFMNTGQTMTELLEQQKKINSDIGELRFPNALIFWLCCDQDELDRRLHDRVDEMISSGLIEELERFHEQYNLQRLKKNEYVEYTKGVFQSIGLKEFHGYLMMPPETKNSPAGKLELVQAVAKLKRSNVQYSKLQYRFIRNKFITVPPSKQVPIIFQLDCTDLNKWHDDVEMKASAILKHYLERNTEELHSFLPMFKEPADPDRFLKGNYSCGMCNKIFENKFQWKQHTASNSHRKRLYNLKVKELQYKIRALGPSPPVKKYDALDSDECILEILEMKS